MRPRQHILRVIAMEHGLLLLQPWFADYGALALFLILYLECFGAPLPGETVLIATSVLAARGEIPLIQVIGSAWLGAVLGSLTGYIVGRLGGRLILIRLGPYIGLAAERYESIAERLRRNGFVLVLIARFVVLLRQVTGLTAGAVAMPLLPFLAANAAGAALWVAVWTLGPYLVEAWLGLSSAH